jgi:hypothetical protein
MSNDERARQERLAKVEAWLAEAMPIASVEKLPVALTA